MSKMKTVAVPNQPTKAELLGRSKAEAKASNKSLIALAISLTHSLNLYGKPFLAEVCDAIGKKISYGFDRADAVNTCFKFGLTDTDLEMLGWEKTEYLSKHIKERGAPELFEFAKTHSYDELRDYVEGPRPVSNSSRFGGLVTKSERAKLIKALTPFGAKIGRRGSVQDVIPAIIKALKQAGTWPAD